MSIHSTSGLISWTPKRNQAGTTQVTVSFRPEMSGMKKLIRPMMRRSLRRVFVADFERLRDILEKRSRA